MCTRTLIARRTRRPNDSTLGHRAPYKSPIRQTFSRLGRRTPLWPLNRWKLSTTTSLCCSLVIFMWTFPASTWGTKTTEPPPEPTTRDTIYGKIQGHVREILPGKFVEYYLSVPYAAPPLGDLRFENPAEPRPWKKVLMTNEHPPACMQKDTDYVDRHRVDFHNYDEDCLYLNIYVPRTTKKELLPVFAFVHGGSNIVGMAAMNDGDVFASYTDVIVVMMNYRLAAMGFLTMADPELPGNYGLMDQLFALKWIQKNIEFFGGDKNKVTLSGHSAGAGDVGLHTLSSLAKGLFRYSICQSGSATAHWAILKPKKHMLKLVRDYVARMDCNKRTVLEIKHCLRGVPAKSIVSTYMEQPPSGYDYFAVEYKYLFDTPENLFARGPLNSETMMMGITKNEGSYAGLQMSDHFETHDFSGLVVQGTKGFPDVPHIDDIIIHEYTQWENPHPENNISAKMSISQLFGDYSLTYPTLQCAGILSKRKFPVYFYLFSHRSTEDKTPDWVGVPHGEDIFYLFGAPLVGHPLRNYTDLDKEVSKKLMTLFGNFVKTGKAFIGTQEFKHYTPKEKLLINFYSENNTAMVSHDTYHQLRRMAFWDNLIPGLREKTKKDRELNHKIHIFQVLTGLFVVLCLILAFTTGFALFKLYERRTNTFSVPTTSAVSTQISPVNTVEPQSVVVDTNPDATAHSVSKGAKTQNTNTEFSPKDA